MFGLGTGEIMIILVLALLLLGPARLPEAAKQIGKGLRSITRATEDVKRQVQTAMYEDERVKPPLQPPVGPPASAVSYPPGASVGEVPPPGSGSEVVAATAANVPGLEAALAEPAPTPALPRTPEAGVSEGPPKA